jgi:hypothetical protein
MAINGASTLGGGLACCPCAATCSLPFTPISPSDLLNASLKDEGLRRRKRIKDKYKRI